jgi:hypothetical protein
VAALKGAALHLGGHVPAGARPAGDVDLLVAADGARALFERLRARGWTVESTASPDHQLPALANRAGGVVELHTYVPGVRLPVGGRRFARLDTLEAAGLLEPRPLGRGRVDLPRREALVAHATAHAIAQHGFSPVPYPLTRALADLCDLDVARADRAMAWALIERDVTPGEIATVESACRLLAVGAIEFLDDPDSPARALLAHAVAGVFDQAYRDWLRVCGLVNRLTEGSQMRAVLGGVGRALRSPRHGVSVALAVARALARRR